MQYALGRDGHVYAALQTQPSPQLVRAGSRGGTQTMGSPRGLPQGARHTPLTLMHQGRRVPEVQARTTEEINALNARYTALAAGAHDEVYSMPYQHEMPFPPTASAAYSAAPMTLQDSQRGRKGASRQGHVPRKASFSSFRYGDESPPPPVPPQPQIPYPRGDAPVSPSSRLFLSGEHPASPQTSYATSPPSSPASFTSEEDPSRRSGSSSHPSERPGAAPLFDPPYNAKGLT